MVKARGEIEREVKARGERERGESERTVKARSLRMSEREVKEKERLTGKRG